MVILEFQIAHVERRPAGSRFDMNAIARDCDRPKQTVGLYARVEIMNLIDQSLVSEYIQSYEGERALVMLATDIDILPVKKAHI
jgi:hypothetical protein